MPEIKRIPQAGKMNRDFHERILPPGEYREGFNINVGRSETSEVGTVENLLGNAQVTSGVTAARDGKTNTCIGSYRDNGNERIYFFVTDNDEFDDSNPSDAVHGVYEYDQISRATRKLIGTNNLNFHKDFLVTGVSLVDELLLWTDDRNEPRKINVDRARQDGDFYTSDNLMALAKAAPYTSPTILRVDDEFEGDAIDSNFLQDKLPRFSYRWRFDDGEYSVLAPFSPIVFSRLGGSETIGDTQTDAGEVPTFINAAKYIQLQTPTPAGFGIVSVELIYKETTSSTLYIVEDKPVTEGQVTVNFDYLSQDPFRTVPPSQLTRVSDAIPRRAKAQEVAGGRVVYGNYLQNFNLPTVDFTVGVQTTTQEPHLPNFSVKSRRTYQVGIILSDVFGRTTPVILSNSGGDTIFVNPQVGTDAFQGLTITFDDVAQLQGFYSYKVVVKQREQEYYNWISVTTASGIIGRLGDSINKIPRDTTAEDPGNSNISPVDVSVYPKLFGEANQTGDLVKVQQINNPAGTATVPGAPTTTDTIVVYETEPVTSELNIFFETSTGGLISGLASDTPVNISFYNCYILTIGGNYHVEANRLRLGFNEPFFDVGVRAHVVNEEYAGEERRANTLIHSSGFFNSRTGLNQLNQFNESEGGITLSLDPSDGSIQLLYAEDTQLIIWQEDKVSRSPIDKDFIYSAEGGAVPVTSNTQYLGTVAPYAGEYGISRDPSSFAIYGTQKYFTDKNRGVVLRLSQDGLTEISRAGMSDFFRDALRTSTKIVGSFNEYHNVYNLTISGEAYDRNEDTNVATADEGYFTIGYEDDVRGWVSFKSYEQESGLTLNNTYYTFSGGNLWEHNRLDVDRNTFYGGETASSYVDFIFNDGPSQVKEFKTLGYEGEDGWECSFIKTDIETVGTIPSVNDNYIDVTLDITTNDASNTIFSGERVAQVISGQPATFVVVVRPISLQYDFDRVEDVTLSVMGIESSDITSSLSDDGNIYFTFDATYTADTTITATLGGNGAGLAFEVSLLTVNVFATEVENMSLVGNVSRTFDATGEAVERILFDADVNYYIAEGDLTALADAALTPHLNGNITIDAITDADNATVVIPLTVPEDPSTGSVTVTGSASLKPELTWIYTDSTADGILTQVFTPNQASGYRRSPREADVTRRGVLIVSATDTYIFLNDDITLNVENGSADSETISGDAGGYTAEIISDIATADTTTTVSFTGGPVLANIGFYANQTLSATGNDNVVLSNNRNVSASFTADRDWITFTDDVDVTDVPPGMAPIFNVEDFQAEWTLSGFDLAVLDNTYSPISGDAIPTFSGFDPDDTDAINTIVSGSTVYASTGSGTTHYLWNREDTTSTQGGWHISRENATDGTWVYGFDSNNDPATPQTDAIGDLDTWFSQTGLAGSGTPVAEGDITMTESTSRIAIISVEATGDVGNRLNDSVNTTFTVTQTNT